MKQFALRESTAIRIAAADFKPRKSGKRKEPGVRLDVGMLVTNLTLDQLWPGFRERLYREADGQNAEAQRALEGIDAVSTTPLLIFPNLKPIRFRDELTGYKATVEIGIGRKESAIELTDCTLDKFEADLKQGGAVQLRFRISSVGLNKRQIGDLGILVDCDVALLLEPPPVQDPLTGIDQPPGVPAENTGADVAEDTRHRKAGKPSGVSRIQKKITTAAKKAAAKKKAATRRAA
jgi:hypothetical protein